MNQSLYRIIFNKARGCLMAVSELASSHSSGKEKSRSQSSGGSGGSQLSLDADQADGTRFGFPKPLIQAINGVVLLSMLLSSLSAPLSAYAQIRSDPNAPGNQRPTILTTANGLPQVNIQTPSAAGVSRNQYSQFDVDNRGAVINNSRTNTSTQLGGMVQGNPWLAQGSARIIVNEVNSSNPSYLNGYIEVAGQRAEIVIANPAGISVNGGGFINTSSATLTTGSPIINGGNLEGYAVQKGTISIDGYGLDASLTDYTGILARSVQVNAGIWANNLNIVTGANQISADQSSSTPIAGVGGAPSFALDVSSLGGMYAGKISLIGTEAGVGVRNAGYLGASGDLSINADGILINSGLINSSANTSVTVKGTIDNSGAISAQGNTLLNSSADIVNSGSISAGGALALSSGNAIKNSGGLTADGNVTLSSANGINNSGQIYASGNTTLQTAGDISNSGMVAAQGNTSLTTTAPNGNIVNTKTSVIASGLTPDGQLLNTGNLTLNADGQVALKGLVLSGNQLSVNSGSLDIAGVNLSTGALALNAKKGDLDATGATITVTRELDLQAAQALKTDAAIVSAGNVAITAAAWSNAQGQILQFDNTDTNIAVSTGINNTEGYIASNAQNLKITSTALDNTRGNILHAGAGTATISTGQLGLTDGKIVSNGGLNLTANGIDGARGALVSKGNLQVAVAGDARLTGGQLGAGGNLNLSASSLNVSGGQVTSEGALTLNVANAVDNSAGLIASNKNVTLTAGALNNNSGMVVSGEALTIKAAIDINNTTGKIQATGALNIAAQGNLDSSKGLIVSDSQLDLHVAKTLTTDSALISADVLGIMATDWSNVKGQVVQTGTANTSIVMSGAINNTEGYIASNGKNLSITSASLDDTKGNILHAGTGLASISTGQLGLTDGKIASNGSLDLAASGIDGARGVLASKGNLQAAVTGGVYLADGQMSAGEKLNLTAANLNISGAQVASQDDLNLNIAGETNNSKGLIVSNKAVTLSTGALDNNGGTIAGNAVDINTNGQSLSNVSGAIGSKTTLTIQSGALNNDQGSIQSGGDMAINTGGLALVNTNGDAATGKGILSQGTLSLTTGDLNNTAGYIAAVGKTDIVTSSIVNNAVTTTTPATSGSAAVTNTVKGTIISTDELAISTTTGDFANVGGQIQSTKNLSLNINGSLDNTQGLVASNAEVSIHAASINNKNTKTETQVDKLDASGQVVLDAAGNPVKETKTDIKGIQGKTVTLIANNVDNTQGGIIALDSLTIQGAGTLDNTKGMLSSSGNLTILDTIASIDAAANVNQATKTQQIINTGGVIVANKKLTIDSKSATGGGSILNAGFAVDVMQDTAGKQVKKNTAGKWVYPAADGSLCESNCIEVATADVSARKIATDSTLLKKDATGQYIKIDADGNPILVNGNPVIVADADTKTAQDITQGDISLKLVDGFNQTADGRLQANGNLNVATLGAMTNAGIIVAGRTATISATGLNNAGGTLQSVETLTLDVGTGTVDNTQGLIASGADLSIKAGSIVNKNTKIETIVNKLDAQGQTIMDNATGLLVQETKYDIKGIQGRNVTLTASSLDNSEGGILAKKDLNIVSSGAINNSKGMLASGDTTNIAAASLNNTEGVIQSTKNLTINAGTGVLDNNQGLMASSGDIDIKSGSLINKNTKIETLVNKLDATGQVVNDANGNPVKETKLDIKGIQAKNVTLSTGAIDNTDGGILASETLAVLSTGDLNNTKGMITASDMTTIAATGVNNTQGTIQSAKALTLNVGAGTLNNTQGLLASSTDLTVNADTINNQNTKEDTSNGIVIKGVQGKTVTLNANHVNNTQGGVLAVDSLSIVGSGIVNNTNGLLSSTGDLTIKDTLANPTTNADGKTQQIINTNGAIVANKTLTIDSKSLKGDGAILNAGVTANGVTTEGDTTIKLLDTFTQTSTGSIQANGNLDMRTKGDVTNAGLIQSRQALSLQATNIDNQLGGEISAGATQVAANTITNRGLIDGGFTLLQASEINNLGTGRIYGDQISILAGSLNNAAETVNTGTGAAQKSAVIAARERLDIGASVITNQDGALLMSLGDMAIGKELDVNGKATGQADAFLNNSATVDVQGKLDINAGVFMNKDLYGTSVSGTTEEKYIVYTKVDPVDASSKSILFTGGKWDDHTGGARNCTTSATNTLCPTNEQWNALYTNPQTGGDATNATYVSSAGSWEYNDGRHTVALTTNDGDVFNHPLWRLAFVTKTTTSTGETSKDPASILVGGGMTLNANTAINDKSKIIVGGDLTVTADNLQNIGGGGSSVTTQHDDYWYSKVVGGTRKLTDFAVADWTPVSDYWSSAGEVSYNTVPVHTGNTIDARKDTNITTTAATVTEVAAAGTPSVGAVSTSNTATTTAVNTATATSATGNSTIGSNNTVASGAKATNVAAATGTAKPINKVAAPGGASLVVRTSNTAAKLPTNSLYIIQPTSANHSPKGYLVETDPRFTQNKQWLGSDYMLTQLGYDPALQTQRLGDGFYEQKLLREQVAQLTGRRFIDNNGESFTNDDEEYKALMNAGVLFAQQYGLIPGVALTAEQMALLTTDIVWLVEQEVTLPDGTKTKALVPQVYALVKPGDIDGSGNLISAKSIDLKLKGDMVNSGLMAARGNLSINANNISNLAGSIKGMDVSLMANNDIQSIQANIQAGNSLNIGAGRDVIVVAGNIGAGGNANITAGNNLILAAQERGSQLIESKDKFDANGNRINKDNYGRSGTYDQTGGTMNIGGSLNMSASNDFLAQGTQINAGGGVNISAGHNASITTAQKGSYYESVDTSVVRKKKWFGLAKTKTTTTITHTSTDIDNTVSTINGGAGSVNINAGNDVNIIGANISGASGVQVNAGNNTNILAAYNIHEHIDTKTVKTNGVGRFVNFIQGDLAPLIGIAPSFDRKPTDTSTTDINSTRTALLPTINGGSGNVSLTAGNVLTLQAPQITGGSFTFGGGGDQRTVAGDQIANALGAATDNQTASGGLDGLSGLVRGGITNNGADSKTRILMAVDSKEVSHTATSRSFIWQSSESSGSISQTAHLMNVNVPVGMTNFVGNGGISVQLPAGSKLPAQIAELAKQPGNEYLTDLANRSDIDWKRVDVINKTWDYKKEGLTAEAAIIVAIVVTILTAGAASSAGVSLASSAGFATTTTAAGATVMATAGGAAFAGAVTAGITTLATQAAIALINNKGDVGAAVKDLGSKENIKGLVTAMATAGLVQGLGDVITFPVGEAGAGTSMTLNQIAAQGGKATLVQSLGANLIKGVTSTVITTAINGGDLEDNLINSIKTAIITSVAAQGANAIGNAKLSIDGNDPLLNQFTATLAHAVLGCAAGSATAGKATGSGGGCAAGAGGAVIGELGAEWYGKTFPGATDADIANFAKLTTALAALPGGANAMTIAGVTSNNAVQNNYLNHTQWNKFAADIAACKAKASGCSASEEKAITAYYQDISTQQNIALANCEKTNNCTALKAEVALGTLTMSTLANTNQLPIGGAVGNDLGQSIGQRLANDPAYRQRVSDSIAVLNNCNANPSQCTEQAIKAAAIVVFPLLAPAGVGFTATGVIAGGSIGAAGNVAGQLVANGGQVSQINLTDAAMGAYTGALTYGATLWPSLFINVGGAVVTSAIKDDKPAGTGGSMAGAALGTGAGYFAGAGVQAGLDKLMNPWYKPVWQDLGLTIQTWIKPSPVPGVGGAVVGGVLQEGVNCGVNCPPTKPTVQVVK